MITSLYVHIPFCKHICKYCDFCKVFYDVKKEEQYIDVLLRELGGFKISCKLKTIYIGGGSPSCLSVNSLRKLLSFLRSYLDEDYEFSIEVNPEDIGEEKVRAFKEFGVNRISVGVQCND